MFGSSTATTTASTGGAGGGGGLFGAGGGGGGLFGGLGGKPNPENANKNVFGSTSIFGGATSASSGKRRHLIVQSVKLWFTMVDDIYYSSFTLPETDSGTDSDSNCCPIQKYRDPSPCLCNVNLSMQCEHVLHSTA